MDQIKIAKQMMQLKKSVFDCNYKAMTMISEQSERMLENFLSQAPGLPEEGKKAVKDWISAYRTGCNDFKKLVDTNYGSFEDYLNKA